MAGVNQVLATAASRIAALQRREIYESSLIEYADYVWPVVEPAIPFVRGWAIEAIAEHLEAVTFGYIKRLLINVPPGFSKSLLTDVFWPSWEWGPRNMPWLRYVCASYSNHLTVRDNMRCRNIIVSDRYQKLWGNRFHVSEAEFNKIKFANDQTGWKLATSVGGIGVGERGDRFIVDDPNNTMEMESEQSRYTTNMWFTEVVPDRLNNMKESAIVVIQQRLHEEDVSGVAISRDMGYTHLMIPMEYEPQRHCVTVIGIDEAGGNIEWDDPRSQEGELAWPERFPPEVCQRIYNDKGAITYAGQYQQRPSPKGGTIIKEDWWNDWEEAKFPPLEYILASLDTAYTEKEENDPSAMTVWGIFRDPNGNPKIILLWAWEAHLAFPDLVNKVLETCVPSQANKGISFPVDSIVIESKAAGISMAQELRRLIGGSARFSIQLFDPKKYGDKTARAHSISHMFQDGMVYAPLSKSFADSVVRQCSLFPRASHDDLVDTTTQALRLLRDSGFALRRDEYSVEQADEMAYRSPAVMTPLYPV